MTGKIEWRRIEKKAKADRVFAPLALSVGIGGLVRMIRATWGLGA